MQVIESLLQRLPIPVLTGVIVYMGGIVVLVLILVACVPDADARLGRFLAELCGRRYDDRKMRQRKKTEKRGN